MIDRTNSELEQQIRKGLRGRRFLAAGGRSGNGHGYLSQPQRELQPGADPPDVIQRIASAVALCDEPEAVGPAIVDAQTELARHYNQLRRAREIDAARANRRGLSIDNRVKDARRRAKDQHVDVSRDLDTVMKMVDRARRAKHRLVPAAAIQRMEAVETRLDGPVEQL